MFKLDPLSMQSFCQKTPSYIHEKKPNHPYFHHVKGFLDLSTYKQISLHITITVVFRTPCKIIHLDVQQGEQCAGGCSLVTPKGIRGENRTLLGHVPSLLPPPPPPPPPPLSLISQYVTLMRREHESAHNIC